MFVLDTNVLSELMRPTPEESVVRWVAGVPAASLFTTTITQAELLYGVALLDAGRRRDAVGAAINAMLAEDFHERILPFDGAAAESFAEIAAQRRAAGRPISQHDAQIVAIAASRGARIATRNTADFQECGVDVVNPW